MRKRQNVFEMESDWADPILWYARGIKAMKARKLEDPTSWNFYAAIHGIWRGLWDFYQITDSGDADPNASDTSTYLDQCQHQSWYFLPWHRGYLLALENMLRHEIELLGGPSNNWALPYWSYFGSNQDVLPPAFRTSDWPDGIGNNPLFVVQRWGQLSGSTPFDVSSQTNLNAMQDPEFTGPGGGGSAGFGGVETGFSWSGDESGGIESDPHNMIHVLVGGGHPTLVFPPGSPQAGRPLPGLMSNPLSAALDPIFYLHHCNIDRLWESWNKFPAGKPSASPTDWQNPTETKWLDGPASTGEREFAMPNPDKTKWAYTPAQMRELAGLGYEYDDLTPGSEVEPIVTVAARMERLGIPRRSVAATGGLGMPTQNKVELVAASDSGISLVGSGIMRSSVRVEPNARARVSQSLSANRIVPTAPDRVFLNLENVTGLHDAVIFQVYVGLPEGAEPSGNKKYLAGSVALFGVSQASDPAGKHSGNGITYKLEITDIVDKMHLDGEFDVARLPVSFVPLENIPNAADIKIGRISIYRQFE
ncbi:tyrosinase family protein [Rhizobium laguerreae]|uniref:tyrosinase family protein n=1 Tax=Rhizobium laguerreae TaxID=1076926 RepID=UPI001C914CA5|nr:tyrosinase family protein [Rhizobium laguerreae]MBY3211773.1 tyrosinase family protein [Rhizobium laguerreae]